MSLRVDSSALGKKIKAKEITVAEAVNAAFEQIEAERRRVNSLCDTGSKKALKSVQRKYRKRSMMESLTGPLAGVPVAIKDNMCTKDLLTTCSPQRYYIILNQRTLQKR